MSKTPHASYDTYSLWEHVDRYMTKPKFAAPSRGYHYYPSEASVKYTDKTGKQVTAGGCLRASWYRIKGATDRAPRTPRSAQILHMGKTIEEGLTEIFKEMGIWVANSVRFKNTEYNISGEVDVFLTEPDGTVYGGEIKTAYGYQGEKEIIGNATFRGKPKTSQLLQTLIYCWEFRETIPYFRLIYMFRDTCSRRTFKIELHEENGVHYPKIDGVINRSFTLEDIYARFKELDEYVQKDIIPPPDYDIQYTDERVEELYKIGEISESKYKKHFAPRKPEKAGDWMCAYCDFRKACMQQQEMDTSAEAELPPDQYLDLDL